LFSEIKHAVVMTMGGPVHYFRIENGRQVRLPEVPRPPRLPRIPVQND